jgi:hypothetical protein
MIDLQKYTGKTLTLVQPSFFKNKFELMDGEEIIATMTFTRKFMSGATFEISDKKWEVKQLSFWKSEYGIFKFGYELPFAVYNSKMFGDGIVELPKGLKLNFRYHMWQGLLEIINSKGDVIISAKGKTAIKEKYLIIIKRSSPELEEYPWLILLPGFLSVLRKKNAAAF